MANPIAFPTSTETFEFPILFAGQAQKEFFVNQSLYLLDALLRQCITASLDTPPEESVEGASFIVSAPATGDWEGREDHVAIRIGGAWHFVQPFDGMRLFDQNAGSVLIFLSGWIKAEAPPEPQGGTVIDVEARTAISELSQALRSLGILDSGG